MLHTDDDYFAATCYLRHAIITPAMPFSPLMPALMPLSYGFSLFH